MERKRQQACVGIGGTLLMAMGVLLFTLWRFTSFSVAVQVFEQHIGRWLLWAVVAMLLLGTIGAASAWCWNRCCLCLFAWLALLAGAVILTCGVILLVQPASDAARLERLCEEADSLEALAGLRAPAVIVAAQDSYESMLDALSSCRRTNRQAIRLDACPDAADSSQRPWQSNPHKELFQWAENSFSCSGFCRDGLPLFGLPRGSVNEVSRGRARHACFSSIATDVRRRSLLAAVALISGGVLLLAPAVCACWLACAPPPSRRPGYVHHPEELDWTAVPQDDSDSDSAAWD